MMSNNGQRTWTIYILSAVVFSIMVLLIFHETISSMVTIWMRSKTFAHSFFIPPISLWLVWQKKEQLKNTLPKPNFKPLILVAGGGFTWLVASLVNIIVAQQLAVVSMFIAGIWVILGNKVFKTILFPLLFLYFSVPMGEGLVPWLMEYTAAFTVTAVKLTGVPVYQEGLFIFLPTGSWQVIEACSGIRYLIASVTIGCLFAYLNYTSYWKRVVFLVFSIFVPILANGLRAYIIVMLGYLTDMEFATGDDHIIIGWVFYGLVVLVLFTVGSIWREAEIPCDQEIAEALIATSDTRTNRWLYSLVVVLGVISIWPVFLGLINNREPLSSINELKVNFPDTQNVESLGHDNSQLWGWVPFTGGVDSSFHQQYRHKGASFGLYVHQYLSQEQGAELVNAQNSLTPKFSSKWKKLDGRKTEILLNSKKLNVNAIVLKSNNGELLIWSWYRVGSFYTSNDYVAKALEAYLKITFSRQDSARIIVATPVLDSLDRAETLDALQHFVGFSIPEIETALDSVVGYRK